MSIKYNRVLCNTLVEEEHDCIAWLECFIILLQKQLDWHLDYCSEQFQGWSGESIFTDDAKKKLFRQILKAQRTHNARELCGNELACSSFIDRTCDTLIVVIYNKNSNSIVNEALNFEINLQLNHSKEPKTIQMRQNKEDLSPHN